MLNRIATLLTDQPFSSIRNPCGGRQMSYAGPKSFYFSKLITCRSYTSLD